MLTKFSLYVNMIIELRKGSINMADTRKIHKVTWINNSESVFEVDMTDEEKLAVKRFLDVASEHVVGYDMPSVYFAEKE